MNRQNVVTVLIFMILSAYFGTEALMLGMGSIFFPMAGFVPFIVSTLLFLLSIVYFIVNYKEGSISEKSKSTIVKPFIKLLLVSLPFMWSIRYLGLWIPSTVLLCYLYKVCGGRSFRGSVFFSLGSILVSYLLFVKVLQVEVPMGIVIEELIWG